MRDEPIPPVSGPDGETDGADWAEVERRWRTPAPEERIGDVRFSLWKTDTPLRAVPHRFSPSFFAVAILASFGFIALGAWAAGRIRQGDFLAGQIFAIGLFVAMYVVPALVVIILRRQKPQGGVAAVPPEGIPSQAVACRAGVSRRGRCVGWLWFEGDLMVFRGAGFDSDCGEKTSAIGVCSSRRSEVISERCYDDRKASRSTNCPLPPA